MTSARMCSSQPSSTEGTPVAGNQPSFSANKLTASMASQNSGSARPRPEMLVIAESTRLWRLIAEKTPSGMPISKDSSNAITVSSMVSGRRSPMDLAISRWSVRERPRSPRNALPSQPRYCSCSGRLSPICSRSTAMASTDASGPAASSAAPPGMICTRPKIRMVPNKTVGITAIRRLNTTLHIGVTDAADTAFGSGRG